MTRNSGSILGAIQNLTSGGVRAEVEKLEEDLAHHKAEVERLTAKHRADKSRAKAMTKEIADKAQQIKDLEKICMRLFKEARGFALLPPPELRIHVGRTTDASNWWSQGQNSSRRVIEIFGESPAGLVLDWGCGSGRTLNWLYAHPGWREMYRGCDVDAEAIKWLRKQGFDKVEVCGVFPPLPYPDGAFVGLFNFSVLTHIEPDRHHLWYKEMARILKPGGIAHITVQSDATIDNGKSYLEEEREAYRRTGQLFSEREGHYKHSAVVSESFTRAALDGVLEIERYSPSGYARMDEIIARKV